MKTKVGWVLTVLPSLLLLFSGFNKIVGSQEMLDNLPKMGIDASLMQGLGILEVIITVLFLIPRTTFIGAILVTGWMGGAIFTHVRLGDSVVMQVVLAIIVWVGFGLRHYDEVLGLLGIRRSN